MEWKYQGEDKKQIPGQKFLKKEGGCDQSTVYDNPG